MSIVSISSGEPTVHAEDLKAIAAAHGFTIPPGTLNETEFLLFANSFDATCATVLNLPEYELPELAPTPVLGGERTFQRPKKEDNPLNAWSHSSNLQSSDPTAVNGLLAGRTIAVKDNVSVAGCPLTLGGAPSLFKGGKYPVSPIDAIVVKRILEAGATLKGTATCENLSMFALSITSHSGVVHNPLLPGYATGGSSSGCAALVSANEVIEARKAGGDSRDYPLGEGVDMAIGGDQGGSIRIPAAYSGIFGLKPTHGLVPYTGIASLNPMIDHTGPMARTVEDTALLLQAIAGWDGLDFRFTPDSPSRSAMPDYHGNLQSWISQKKSIDEWTSTAAAKGLRIGILKESFEVFGLDSTVAALVQKAAERFKSLGADVKDISIPLHAQGAAIWTIAARPLMPHAVNGGVPDLLAHTMPHLDPVPIGQTYFDTLTNRNPAAVNVLMNAAQLEQKYGNSLASKAYMHAIQLSRAYDAALAEVDVLLTPINPTVGPKIPTSAMKTESNPNGFSDRLMDLFEPAIGNTLNTCPLNITGHPAMSMPICWSEVKEGNGRLPVGMQVIAKKWGEENIFKAAKAWEMGGSWRES